MLIGLYFFAGVSGVMGFFILVTAAQYNFRHLGLTLGGLSYLVSGLITIYLLTWWPLVVGWLFALIIKKVFGDPAKKIQ